MHTLIGWNRIEDLLADVHGRKGDGEPNVKTILQNYDKLPNYVEPEDAPGV